MRKLIFAMITFVAVAAVGCDDYNAPESLRSSFDTQYPTAIDVEWERKRGHVVAEFEIPGVSKDCEAWYTKSGRWIMTEFDIPYSELPQAVRNSFEAEYGTAAPIDGVSRVERNGNSTIYIIETTLVVNGFLTDIYLDYDENGTLLRTSVDVENYDNIYYYL